MLFLHPGIVDGSGAFAITGLMQGNFHYLQTPSGIRLSNGTLAAHARDTVEALTDQGYSSFQGTTIREDELEAKVRAAAAANPMRTQ